MSAPLIQFYKREIKRRRERKMEEGGKKRFFGIKSGVWLVLKGCHGRKLMAINPGGEEAGGRRETGSGSGLCKASAQPQEFRFKSSSGLDSPEY